jgi:hypothetical protein
MALLLDADETLDGGQNWTDFWNGRIHRAQLVGKLRFTVTTRDRAEDLKAPIFPARPHTDAVGAVPAVLPVGLLKAYGPQQPVVPLAGSMSQVTAVTVQGVVTNWGVVTVAVDHQARRTDNVITRNLLELVGYTPEILASTSTAFQVTSPPGFDRTRLYARVKRTDTGAQGEFLVGTLYVSPRANMLRYARTLVLSELRPPAGVATGTPLVNNGAGYAIGAKSIATDGWTINITGIVKKGDLVKFGHSKHYTVQADVNSNGSGQATLTLEPGLAATIADNEPLTVMGEPGFMKMPPNTTAVEITLFGDARTSPTNAIVVNDIHPVQMFRDILDGHYSRIWRRGETIPTGWSPGDPIRTFPYDATAFATLIADATFPKARFILTGTERASDFIEAAICQPYQIGYYVDAAGKVVPVDLRMPTSLAGIPTITDTDLIETVDAAQWEHTRESAIARARITYYEDSPILPAELLATPQQGFSSVASAPVVERALLASHQKEVIVYDLGASQLSDVEVTIDARGMRFMEGDAAIDGMGRALWAAQKLAQFAQHLRQPGGFGAQTAVLKGHRASTTSCKPGELRLVDVDPLPDPATHKRGGIRLMRCLEPSEDGLVMGLRMLDLAVNVVASVPTLAQPVQMTGNTRHGASSPVTVNASSEPVEVHYAVTATSVGAAPAEASALWTFADYVTASRDVSVTRLPTGQRIWFRGRTVAAPGNALKLPSAWAAAGGTGYVDLATATAPSALAVPGGTLTARRAIATWTNGDANLFTEIRLSSPTTDPPVRIATVPPGQNRYELLGLDPSTSYKIEILHVDSAGPASTAVNTTFTTGSSALVAPNPGGIAIGVGAA